MDNKLYVTGDFFLNDTELELDICDIILANLGETVFRASVMFGDNVVAIDAPDCGRFSVERPLESPGVLFEDRISAIVDSCNSVCGSIGVSYSFIAPRMFVIDGWSWNRHVFRSPIWMNDHRDVPIDEARKIEGLQWLDGSSLEIKFGREEV